MYIIYIFLSHMGSPFLFFWSVYNPLIYQIWQNKSQHLTDVFSPDTEKMLLHYLLLHWCDPKSSRFSFGEIFVSWNIFCDTIRFLFLFHHQFLNYLILRKSIFPVFLPTLYCILVYESYTNLLLTNNFPAQNSLIPSLCYKT